MTNDITIPQDAILKPQITVFGVGGAGGNATNNMIQKNLEGANFVVANTDAQALEHSVSPNRIQLGRDTTKGLGAGASPEVGKYAAEETAEEIMEHLRGSNMAFITAGMGGGTGTGAAPVVARLAREMDILTVAVVTKPFHFEGPKRMRIADLGLEELQKNVDTLLIIPNQNLFRVANERTTFAEAFAMADDVLHAGVRSITDLMVMPGLINLDFADVRAVMTEMGKAMMGTGEAEGERRAYEAAEAAISNPLLDNASMKGAKGVLINITGGPDMTLFEVDEAANRIREEVDTNANIIFGSTFDEALNGSIRVSVVATGIDKDIDEDDLTLPGDTAKIDQQRAQEQTVTGNRYYSRPGTGFSGQTPAQSGAAAGRPHQQNDNSNRNAFTRKVDIPAQEEGSAPFSKSNAPVGRRESNNPYRNGMASEFSRRDINPRQEQQPTQRTGYAGNNDLRQQPFQAQPRQEYGNAQGRAPSYAPQDRLPSQHPGYEGQAPAQPSGYDPRGGYPQQQGAQDDSSFYSEQEFRHQSHTHAQREGVDDSGGIFSKVAKMARSLQKNEEEQYKETSTQYNYRAAPQQQQHAQQPIDNSGYAHTNSADPAYNNAPESQYSSRPHDRQEQLRPSATDRQNAFLVEQPASRSNKQHVVETPANTSSKEDEPKQADVTKKEQQPGSLFDRSDKSATQEVSEVPAFMRKKNPEHA